MASQSRRSSRQALRRLLILGLTLCLSVVAVSSARALTAHGQLLRLARRGATARAGVNANQSNNWFGYNQGALEPGQTLFHAITGNWIVPRASQHTKHEAEYSSDWIGIGGGCENSNCSINDPTLIQTGTEQDVSATGQPSYSAWWEVIPGPALSISMNVRPGDHIHASLSQVRPMIWKIVLDDRTRHEHYSTTVPYSSSEGTAEWIEETPLVFGAGAGFAPLPNLSPVRFDHATANGRPAKLKTPQEMVLTGSSGNVVSVPSRADRDRDGFNACAWARSCRAPRTS